MFDEKEMSTDAVKIEDLCERRGFFGSELKELRTVRGMTVAEVANRTRINHEYIEAIESGKFEVLPGRLFGRGFVSALLKHYGLVNAAIVSTYDQLWVDDGIQNAISDSTKGRLHEKSHESPFGVFTFQSKFKLVHVVAAGILLLGLTAGSFIAYKKGRQFFARSMNQQAEITVVPVQLENKSDSETEQILGHATVQSTHSLPELESPDRGLPEKKNESSKAEAAPESKKKDSANATGKQVLTITVVEPVKVKIESDNGKPAVKDLVEGVYSFNFDSSADLLIYDAAAVRISFNGTPLGSLGSKGRVRRIGFRSEAPNQKSF